MMPGPMFAVTLAKSFKSPWAGIQLSLGHAVVEVPLILLIYFGFASFFEEPALQLFLSVVGGSMIAWMGIAMFRARTNVVRKGKDLPYSAFVGGIMASGLNPFFLLWWATVGALLVMRFLEFGLGGLFIFITVHWLTDLLWLSFISVLVYRTHRLWGTRLQEWVFIVASVLLIGFGVWFVVSGVQMVV
jgi:threonine/homoserine/homoserine lactone efflux protein